jgi:hypothetical protein
MNTKFVHKANKIIPGESLWRKCKNRIISSLLFALIKTYFFIPVLIDNIFNFAKKVKSKSQTTVPNNPKEIDFVNLKYSNKVTP